MDRIINVNVSGHHISKDGNVAGAQGEGNAVKLRITFDANWLPFTKTVTFWDAHGANPVKYVLGTDLLEYTTEESEAYCVPIPQEPMAIAGKLMFVIDGFVDDKRQRSVGDELVVEESPITASYPTNPTPTEIEQIQQQIDVFKNKVNQATVTMAQMTEVTQRVELAETSVKATTKFAEGFARDAQEAKEDAEDARDKAEEYWQNAEDAAERAEDAASKAPYIEDNGNWFAWNTLRKEFYDTEVKAQSGSTVYYGDNPPDEADVWIDPNGTPSTYTKRAFINLKGGADNWSAENVVDENGNVIGMRYGQEVDINNAVITPNSKVDLQVNSEQMVIFYEKDLAFVAENDGGVITVYCIGSVPQNDYTIQVTITEVVLDD